jgi:hypothetical protein
MKGFLDFSMTSKVSCDLVTEGSYINCSDKEPEKIKPKDQGFDEATEKIVDTKVYIFHLETCFKQNTRL